MTIQAKDAQIAELQLEVQAVKDAALIQSMASINCHNLPVPQNENGVRKIVRQWSNDSCNMKNLQERGVKVEDELKECYGELLQLKSQPSGGSYSTNSIIDDIRSQDDQFGSQEVYRLPADKKQIIDYEE